ncbi:hypothetical protein E4T56_gene2716 [Termitomyces sp. T112]|nr:hypothetical protein E4T56_gene2716 [Termitomyces sp. T112]
MPNIFSALATLLCATILTPDTLPAHLPSHFSHTLLLHTTLPFSADSVPTLNQYKGSQYPNQQHQTPLSNPATTLDPAAATPSPTFINPKALDIKIIGAIPFACNLQDSTPTFQL